MDDIKDLLDAEAARINSPAFISEDPVQFPRMFDDARDAEIAALLCATIAWGNRKMICRDCQRMLSLMEMRPYDYMMDRGYEELPPEGNVHRTFFNRNLQHYLRGLRRVYERHGSLQEFAVAIGAGESEFPAWRLAEGLLGTLAAANDGAPDARCLPQRLDTTALKRLNMALRWLVRDDGIVDLGIWDCIRPSQLYVPLDVHVAETSRQLGLLTRKSNDRKAVAELTGELRRMRPDDPVYYDYALFGIGMRL